ncbi:lysocardiolipin acyltransferase 1 isoform X4 [Camelus ferus]|uniref:Lysocardiolipin acyltransferase 1 isoform X4 n=2 Tax=Camelus TaxID=9836 RepID=A0A8B8UF12_CAMFR|nr:lysocardiolipin acyltransferase 1 isoform X7 [Camelus dromedarius]XP_032353186.1 lysocardiolipin acyltransferase 1 isoform X4 [Camelus ferus]XP_045367724.1 lysocardiolipin acyltransferase 1 isoform X4 [Camelus bactrianus]
MVSWRGIYFILTLFWGSFFGSIFMLGPFLPLMFINPSWYRWINNRIVATWLTLPVALLETMFGVKVIITGDAFVPGERSVIIMNHRTRMDWMFLWSCLMRYSYLRLEKICLKASLKSVPGFGWAMQAAAYIFIHRKWKDDRSHFEDMIDYFCDIHEPLQLLIFPEGTDLTESTTARSNDFAEKNGLQKYEYVLHPRTTGFTFVVDRLREVFLLRVSASEILLMRPSLQPCASLYLLTSGEKSCSGAMYYLTPASWCERFEMAFRRR